MSLPLKSAYFSLRIDDAGHIYKKGLHWYRRTVEILKIVEVLYMFVGMKIDFVRFS